MAGKDGAQGKIQFSAPNEFPMSKAKGKSKLSPPRGRDFATGRAVNLSAPEEEVRQAYERMLHFELGYPKEVMDIEVAVQIGSRKHRADIAVYDSPPGQGGRIVGVVEAKSPGADKGREGREQLRSYMSVLPACKWGVWTNGDAAEVARKNTAAGDIVFDPAFFIPRFGADAASIQSVDDLRPAHNLKMAFRQINNLLYANTNLTQSARQGAEMTRLLFCKICDEHENKIPQFQVKPDEDPAALRARVEDLWRRTRDGWLAGDIFSPGENVELDARSLALVVSRLQGFSLRQTDRDVVGDAFEVFSERQFAGEKGQFFTPRAVVKMAVEMLNPGPDETIMDPACGSGGFLIHALSHVWRRLGENASDEQKRGVANRFFFGADKDLDIVRICKAHMCLMGDGRSNIVQVDSLAPPKEWGDAARGALLDGRGEPRQYDVILTNPPFGAQIKVSHRHILEQYQLARKWKKSGGRWKMDGAVRPTAPQILFVELCLRLLKDGGRMAIVLPDGLLGNEGDGYARQFIREHAEILAVVDCPQATFMPHTGTKTSVLLLRKFHRGERSAGPIFFAIAEKCGHTMRGRAIYRDEERSELDEDFSQVAGNYAAGKDDGRKGFKQAELRNGILTPRYYDPRIAKELAALRARADVECQTLGEMEDAGLLRVSGIGRHPSSEECAPVGEYRYIRTADLGSFELRGDTRQKVDAATFEKYRAAQDLHVGDILFVKDGDTRIGDSVILFEDDLQILAQGHFHKIRALSGGPDPFLLLRMLNIDIVKRQIRQRVFSQATLSTIGARVRELTLPMPKSAARRKEIADKMRTLLESRRQALKELRATLE